VRAALLYRATPSLWDTTPSRCLAVRNALHQPGTEANNIAIRGTASANQTRNAVVTTSIEPPATEACCALLESIGHRVTHVAPKADAIVDPEKFVAAINAETSLATMIHARNETGTLQPVAEIGSVARTRGALFPIRW
jgi:cysteine desulfurase